MTQFVAPLGPIFGPDFVVVTTNDDNGTLYQLQVFPDANNEQLRAAGRPMQFYWQPARVYIAKQHNNPQDYDFSLSIFKGLMTSETTVGVSSDVTTDGTLEMGGGFCTFSTTFAVPPSVIVNAQKALKESQHSEPKPWLQRLFGIEHGQPEPVLGIMPIMENQVTIEVPNLVGATAGSKVPMFIDAQGAGKGSIEAQGISSFLVTCNQFAAGAIAGSLKAGHSPFTVHCTLREQVYIHACEVTVTVDVDKCYDQVSAALEVGGFLGICEASLQASYQNMVTSGGITTEMKMDNANLTPELQEWIRKNVDDMKATAFSILKSEIFDWKPREDPPATASRGLFSSIFGGASVSLKASHQRHAVKLSQTLKLDTTISVSNTIAGDLNDLLPSVAADVDRYVVTYDIGEGFKKVQVAATNTVNFAEKVGTLALNDPIQSVGLQVAYPDYTTPVDANGNINLVTTAEGFHYTVGAKDHARSMELMTWSDANPKDIVNAPFLRLDKDVEGWPRDQVKLTKTIAFDGLDPRVDLANGSSIFSVTTISDNHAPVISVDEVGYLFARIMLSPRLPAENVVVTLHCTIGSRTDTIVITTDNQANALWEVYSDKYFDETSVSYTVDVEITGASFTDEVISYSSPEVVIVPIPEGRIKCLNPLKVALPPAPADKVELINAYINAMPG